MAERAVLYARISYDRRGAHVGVTRQMDAMKKLASSRGWQVVEAITENDISATKGLDRPGYDRVWSLVTAGKVDHVVVWQSSRLMRSRRDRAAVIEAFGHHRVDVVAVEGPSLDLRSAYGRGSADLMTALDTMEGEVKAERVAEALADLKKHGKPWGLTPYGWDRTPGGGYDAAQTVNPHEAGVVAELVDRLLAGESLAGLLRAMNNRGEPSPGWVCWHKRTQEAREASERKGRKAPPKTWGRSTIRTLVTRDVNAAIRERYDDGTEKLGDWPPIVDRAKHDRVVALLRSPERRSHQGPRPGARKHLLTNGIGKCGKCGARLRVGNRARSQGVIYMCEDHGCTGRVQHHVDDLVARLVIGRLSQPDALDWLLGDDEAARRAAQRCDALQLRLDEAADSHADGKITIGQLERVTARLTPQLEAARADRDAATRSLDIDVLRPLAGPEAANRWAAMEVAAQRAVLETLGVEVVLLPRAKHGPGFEPETVQVNWLS